MPSPPLLESCHWRGEIQVLDGRPALRANAIKVDPELNLARRGPGIHGARREDGAAARNVLRFTGLPLYSRPASLSIARNCPSVRLSIASVTSLPSRS